MSQYAHLVIQFGKYVFNPCLRQQTHVGRGIEHMFDTAVNSGFLMGFN
ncbi:hypothetical protein [uncultured Paraglaciecola sp.]